MGLLCGASLPPGPREAVRDQPPRGENLPRSRLAALRFHQQPSGVTVASATSDRRGQGGGPGHPGSLPPILTPAGQGTGAVSASPDTVSADSPQAPRVRPRVAAWGARPRGWTRRGRCRTGPRQPLLPSASSPRLQSFTRCSSPQMPCRPWHRSPERDSCRLPGGISARARGGSRRAGSERTRLPARLRLGASRATATGTLAGQVLAELRTAARLSCIPTSGSRRQVPKEEGGSSARVSTR